MSDPTLNQPSPQFGTAEYVGVPGTEHCQYCHQPIASTYYRINNVMACPACAQKTQGELERDTHSAYVRGLLYGIGAAFVGMILYAAVTIITGLIMGLVSIAVGWMVGKAMMKGSSGIGGRKYQITAAVLTYAAVSMAAVPTSIHFAMKQKQAQQQKAAADQRQLQQQFGQQPSAPAKTRTAPPMNPWKALGLLALIGIASPFYELFVTGPSFGWGIGLLILFFGIQIAVKLTAGTSWIVYGPFENAPKPAV